jgi:hypothetical protein
MVSCWGVWRHLLGLECMVSGPQAASNSTGGWGRSIHTYTPRAVHLSMYSTLIRHPIASQARPCCVLVLALCAFAKAAPITVWCHWACWSSTQWAQHLAMHSTPIRHPIASQAHSCCVLVLAPRRCNACQCGWPVGPAPSGPNTKPCAVPHVMLLLFGSVHHLLQCGWPVDCRPPQQMLSHEMCHMMLLLLVVSCSSRCQHKPVPSSPTVRPSTGSNQQQAPAHA